MDGEIAGGTIRAEILSEKGTELRLEKPGDGYCAVKNGEKIPLTDEITVIPTSPGEILTVQKAD